MDLVIMWIRKSFNLVQDRGSDSTQQRLAEDQKWTLLLDVRSPAEYEVSHLQGAIRVDPETTDMDHLVKDLGLADCDEEREVVFYCTVGYRSSKLAQKMEEFLASDAGQTLRGALRVYNLEGGLVKWANESKPMVDRFGQPTKLVHPYNNMWAYLVKPEFRAPL
ncbi:tRNA uridine(34) hydroxylase-like [Stegostoma tigrinum]|uniref:tRNA uridine(34) hydroxylase-like n=1 Tax=Stegostoma tigrinum TaxID=3053191 RepID=UPI0028702692|nr:tRNA uridine(34) hydroxylase-like [Stegostoma tigrinum]